MDSLVMKFSINKFAVTSIATKNFLNLCSDSFLNFSCPTLNLTGLLIFQANRAACLACTREHLASLRTINLASLLEYPHAQPIQFRKANLIIGKFYPGQNFMISGVKVILPQIPPVEKRK